MKKIVEENGQWFVVFYFENGAEAWRSEPFHSEGFAKRFDTECTSKGQFRKSIKIPFKMDVPQKVDGFV